MGRERRTGTMQTPCTLLLRRWLASGLLAFAFVSVLVVATASDAEVELAGFSARWWQALALVRKRSSSRRSVRPVHVRATSGVKILPPAFSRCPWLVVEEPRNGEIFNVQASILRYSSGGWARQNASRTLAANMSGDARNASRIADGGAKTRGGWTSAGRRGGAATGYFQLFGPLHVATPPQIQLQGEIILHEGEGADYVSVLPKDYMLRGAYLLRFLLVSNVTASSENASSSSSPLPPTPTTTAALNASAGHPASSTVVPPVKASVHRVIHSSPTPTAGATRPREGWGDCPWRPIEREVLLCAQLDHRMRLPRGFDCSHVDPAGVLAQVVIGVPVGHFGVPWCSQDTRELTFCDLEDTFAEKQGTHQRQMRADEVLREKNGDVDGSLVGGIHEQWPQAYFARIDSKGGANDQRWGGKGAPAWTRGRRSGGAKATRMWAQRLHGIDLREEQARRWEMGREALWALEGFEGDPREFVRGLALRVERLKASLRAGDEAYAGEREGAEAEDRVQGGRRCDEYEGAGAGGWEATMTPGDADSEALHKLLWAQQFPRIPQGRRAAVCSRLRAVVHGFDGALTSGLGAQIHFLTALLSYAFRTGRVLVAASPDHWNYAGAACRDGWECYFEPLSACTQASLQAPGTVGIGAGHDGRGGGGGARVLTVFYGDGVGNCEGSGALSSLEMVLNADQQRYVPPRFRHCVYTCTFHPAKQTPTQTPTHTHTRTHTQCLKRGGT